MRGATIRVNDRVTAISIYDGSTMSTARVVRIERAGRKTILVLDAPPDPRYPHHLSHRADKTIREES